MKPTRKISRRSFLGRVAGGALVGGAALTALTSRVEAQVTDSDSGASADPAGRGRGTTGRTDSDPTDAAGRGTRTNRTDSDPTDAAGRGTRTGRTDSDPTDAAGRGGRRTGITDRDTGARADPPGNGRGARVTGVTDGDAGSVADPGGNGRGRPNRRRTGLTDGDSGRYVDRAGMGRGRPRR